MNNKKIISIIVLIILVVIGIFYFIKSTEVEPILNDKETVEDSGEFYDIINAKHQFVDGVHIVVGEINLPTPCHTLSHDVLTRESYPEQVTIEFESETKAEVCAQVITKTSFRVEFLASKEAKISATINGNSVTLNLIEVGTDENLDDFELFIKS